MVKVKKVLFVAPHRKGRSPGQRFRFEQYIAYLEQNNFECEYSFLLNEVDDKVFYAKGKFARKIVISIKCLFIRIKDLLRANRYDVIFIFREAYFFGNTFIEYLLSKSRAKLIFDFDDAIWNLDISEGNKSFHWLKKPKKTATIISYCDVVFAGNKYLSNYAQQFNENVGIIPTTINTEEYTFKHVKKSQPGICIGWSGSITTIKHFEYAIPFLQKIKEKYADKVYFKVIGDQTYRNNDLNIVGLSWKADNEISDLCEIDIGIMPLPNDEWSKGKCGLKGLQYMALNIPTIMSPVGVNTNIIRDGINGFLASTDEEWVEKLSMLIESTELRKKIGDAGCTTVKENYSTNSLKERYINLFVGLTQNKNLSDLLNLPAHTNETLETSPLLYSQNEISKHNFIGKTIYQFNIDSSNIDSKTVKSFGEEWLKFSAFTTKETKVAFNQYFDIVTENIVNSNSIVLDMGCGNGRWSKCLASRVKFIEAMDPSNSVYSALQLTHKINNIRITQASVDNIPFENNSFDFIMSLGVLHHIPRTSEAMKKCIMKLKEGGWFLVYLYYDLEERSIFLKIPFYVSSILRKIISRLPSILKHLICDLLAFLVYLPLIGLSKLIMLIFKNKNWYKSIPLSYYIDKPLIIIRNDALDRFGTPLENRFSKSEIYNMMTEAGLTNIKFSTNEPYWHAVGQKISNK